MALPYLARDGRDRRVHTRAVSGHIQGECPLLLGGAKVEFTTEFDEARDICIVRAMGPHKRPDDSLVLQKFARDIGDKRGCQRFLFDMTQARIIAGTSRSAEPVKAC